MNALVVALIGAVGIWVIIAAFVGVALLWELTPTLYRLYLARLIGFLALSACGSLAAIIWFSAIGWM